MCKEQTARSAEAALTARYIDDWVIDYWPGGQVRLTISPVGGVI